MPPSSVIDSVAVNVTAPINDSGNGSGCTAAPVIGSMVVVVIPVVSAPLPGVTSLPVVLKITMGWPPPAPAPPPAAVASNSIG